MLNGYNSCLSGLVPGILTNRLAIRTRAPACKEGEEVGDGNLTVPSKHLEKWRLFIPQSDHRIDLHRPSGGHISRQ